MGRFWGVLRLRLLLDEDVSGFVGVAILGVKGSYGWGCFRPEAVIKNLQKRRRFAGPQAVDIIPARLRQKYPIKRQAAVMPLTTVGTKNTSQTFCERVLKP